MHFWDLGSIRDRENLYTAEAAEIHWTFTFSGRLAVIYCRGYSRGGKTCRSVNYFSSNSTKK